MLCAPRRRTEFGLLVRDGDYRIRTIDDLPGKKVGVTAAGFPKDYLSGKPGIELIPVENYDEGFARLSSGELDTLAADLWVATFLIEKQGIRGIAVGGPPFATAPASLAVREGNPLLNEINQAISVVKKKGEIERIRRKWRPQEMLFFSRERVRNITIFGSLLLLGLLSIGMSIWVATLSRQIRTRRKTELALRESEERLQLLQMIIMDVAAAATLPEALEVVLRRVCEKTGWALGQAWIPRDDRLCLDCCHASYAASGDLGEFQKISTEMALKSGEGLPGRVWQSRQPLWIPDVTQDPNYPRAEAARKHGLKAGLAVPILAGEEVLAVLEYYVREPRSEDHRLVQVISAIAAQIGVAIDRKWAEQKLRWSEEQLRLLLDSTAEGIFGVNLKGECTFCNAASLRLLGYSHPSDLLGKEMHGLIAHSRADGRRFPPEECGVVQSLRSGTCTTADTEVFWRKDGTSFPAEYWSYPVIREGKHLGAVLTFLDITMRKQAEKDAQASQAQLRGLAGRLQQVREEERTSLAREIHDVLAQELTRLKIDLGWLRGRLSNGNTDIPALSEKVAGMFGLVDAAISCVQKMATELRPVVLDSLGLPAAIEWQTEEFQARTGIHCDISIPDEEVQLPADAATGLFRIVQESLTNVSRHARATAVEVKLQLEQGRLILSVHDNGVGINPAKYSDPHTLGLVGMRERTLLLGGHLEISAPPGGGTTVRVTVPMDQESVANQSHPGAK